MTIALKELAERGSLISQDEGWLILDPPPERRAVEPEPARLIDAPRREMACVPPAEPQPQDGRLAQLQAELDRLRHNHALATATAQDLAAQSRWLRARTLDLIFDAHLLTDVTDQARASTASAANPPGGRLAGLGQK